MDNKVSPHNIEDAEARLNNQEKSLWYESGVLHWDLPPYITESTKGENYAYCKLCSSHFSVSHGGFHDITRHINGL